MFLLIDFQNEINANIVNGNILKSDLFLQIIYLKLLMTGFISTLEHLLPAKRIDIFGKDSLMSSCLPYYILPVLLIYAFYTLWDNAWSLIFITYTLLPFLDDFFEHDIKNPTEEERKKLEKEDFKFKAVIYVTIAIDWYLLFKVLNYFNTFQFTFWETFNLVALFYIFSNFNSLGFMISHEIMHKPGMFNRIVGTLHMSKNLYMHFTYEHLFGHHRKVATPEDPASAEQGIDFYRFFWRSFTGSYKSVYKMEKEINKPIYANYAVLSVVGAIAFTLFIYYIYGTKVTIFFFLEAAFSIIYLEAINYVEHYGLSRKKLPNGQYEKVTIRHSWNAPHRFTNYLLFKLERHSDHHENSLKPYQTLLSLDESPLLPAGYTTMIIVSFFPKIWYEIMDPLVDQYKKYSIGTIKTELTQKSLSLTRQFTIKISIFIAFMWTLSLANY